MPNQRISINYGVTLNVGNFESVRIDIGMERDIQPNESRDEAFRECWVIVKQQVHKRSIQAKKKMIGS